jgi:hypothetical protein
MRSRALLAFLLALPLLPLNVASAAPKLVTRVWQLDRVRGGKTGFKVAAGFQMDERGALAAYVPVTVSAGRVTAAGPADVTEASTATGPLVYSQGATYGCSAVGTCAVLAGPGAMSYSVGAAYPTSNAPQRAYVVVIGVAPTLQPLELDGWRVRLVSNTVRRTVAGQAAAAGVTAEDNTVEHFDSASAAGGRRGSVALGAPPCRHVPRYGAARMAVGTATLTGGRKAASMTCPQDVWNVSAVASGPTTWRLTGPVDGVAWGPTRLLVIDL